MPAQAGTRKEDLDPGQSRAARDSGVTRTPVPGVKTSGTSLTGVTAHQVFTVKWEIQFFFSILKGEVLWRQRKEDCIKCRN